MPVVLQLRAFSAGVVGTDCTLTIMVPVLLQLFWEQVAVYVVLAVGETVMVLPVPPVDQASVPGQLVTDRTVDWPRHRVVPELAVMAGVGGGSTRVMAEEETHWVAVTST